MTRWSWVRRPPRPCTGSRTSPTATARWCRTRTLLRGGDRVRHLRRRPAGPDRRRLRRAVPRHLPTRPARHRAEPVDRRSHPLRPSPGEVDPHAADRAGPVRTAAPGHRLRHPRHDHEPGAEGVPRRDRRLRCAGPVNLVVTTGPGFDPAQLGPLPPAVRTAPFLPQAAVLPHCRAVVSHAGAGTMLGALCHGLPQLCLPQGTDQPFNTAALLPTGAALALAARTRSPPTRWPRPSAGCSTSRRSRRRPTGSAPRSSTCHPPRSSSTSSLTESGRRSACGSVAVGGEHLHAVRCERRPWRRAPSSPPGLVARRWCRAARRTPSPTAVRAAGRRSASRPELNSTSSDGTCLPSAERHRRQVEPSTRRSWENHRSGVISWPSVPNHARSLKPSACAGRPSKNSSWRSTGLSRRRASSARVHSSRSCCHGGAVPRQPGRLVVVQYALLLPPCVRPVSSPAVSIGTPVETSSVVEQVAHHPAAQREHLGVVGAALDAAVPAVVVVGAVAVVLAVGLVVLAVVGHQVVQREAVVRGDEVHRRQRPDAPRTGPTSRPAGRRGRARRRPGSTPRRDRRARTRGPCRGSGRSTRPTATGSRRAGSRRHRRPTARR